MIPLIPFLAYFEALSKRSYLNFRPKPSQNAKKFPYIPFNLKIPFNFHLNSLWRIFQGIWVEDLSSNSLEAIQNFLRIFLEKIFGPHH